MQVESHEKIQRIIKLLMKFFSFFLSLFLVTGIVSCAHRKQLEGASQSSPVGEDKLASPIPSSVSGVEISNVHLVARSKGALYRGMRPVDGQDARDLKKI